MGNGRNAKYLTLLLREGMRASVHVDLPGFTKEGLDVLKKRCEELKVQPRGELRVVVYHVTIVAGGNG